MMELSYITVSRLLLVPVAKVFLKASGPYPAWDTRRGEEFSNRDPNFLNYVE